MLETGQVLQQRYTLKQPLGRTAAGHATWLAIDRETEEEVTIKLLAFSPQMEWNELKLFEREAQVLQSLNHPQIPRYRDYFDLDKNEGAGMPWFALVQDYIPGNSLQDLLGQGEQFSEKQVRQMATQILEILIYLHQLSPPVLHRDIKPSNLILGEDAQVYLIDFGAVQAQAAVTGVTFTVVGTSGYAPLEQFWGRAVPASDIYALGATLIHLLTGVTPAELPQKDGRIQFADKTNTSPHLVAWIQKATLSVERRFQTATEALETLKSEKLVFASPRSGIAEVRKAPKPEKTLSQVSYSVNPDCLNIQIPAFLEDFMPFSLGSFLIGIVFRLIPYLNMILPIALLAYGIINLSIDLILGASSIAFWAIIYSYFSRDAKRKNVEINLDPHFFNLTRRTYYLRVCVWRVKAKCRLEEIKGVFLVKLENSRDLIIRIKTYHSSYDIRWKLAEKEAMWLVDEIRDWVARYQV